MNMNLDAGQCTPTGTGSPDPYSCKVGIHAQHPLSPPDRLRGASLDLASWGIVAIAHGRRSSEARPGSLCGSAATHTLAAARHGPCAEDPLATVKLSAASYQLVASSAGRGNKAAAITASRRSQIADAGAD